MHGLATENGNKIRCLVGRTGLATYKTFILCNLCT